MEERSPVNEINSPAQGFLKHLRQSTGKLHKDLESLPLSLSLMKDDVSIEDYAFYLACMKDVMAFYDRDILKQVAGIIPHTESRQKLSAITNDLEYIKSLGVKHKPVSALKEPIISNIDVALGMAYVIEGSTLGGRVILKHVGERLKFSQGHGTAFFAGYNANTGTMWKEFLDGFTAYAVEHESEKIVEGAVDGFKMIYRHFLENGTSR